MKYRTRKGNLLIVIALLMPALITLAAFVIDIGRIGYARSRLQSAADAAALAGVEELPDGDAAIAAAKQFAGLNLQEQDNVLTTQDVEFGVWDEDTNTFSTSAASGANAVRVTTRLSAENGNGLALFFGAVYGTATTNVAATAIAMREGGGIGTRFLIDDEMIDSDVPSIETLANNTGRDPADLITARGFNQGKSYGASNWTWEDNFLDLPAGAQLSLPTGQGTDYDNNDAGLFDIEYPQFPFSDDNSFRDFVMYSESGGDSSKWGTDASYILSQLDPLEGAAPVTDDDLYPSFVNPDFIHVSPVFESDVSTLNMNGGVPQLNAKGLRRGLLAFKIIDVGNDPDGGGSVLPELVIEVVDPSETSLDSLSAGGASSGAGGAIRLVH